MQSLSALPLGSSHPQQTSPAPVPTGTAEEATLGSRVKDAVHWLDTYTSPRAETAGNFDKPSYFQAAFNGGADGFYLFGLSGVITGAASASTGIAMQRLTGSQVAGVITGSLVGAGLGVAATLLLGAGSAGMVAGAAGGALLGGFETLRGDPTAKNRDSANILSALFVSGPAKMAGSLGSMVGAHMDSTLAKMAVSAVTGAAVGAAVAAAFPAGTGVVAAALISAATGAVGPFVGSRMSQLLRNLGQDAGRAFTALARKCGYEPKEKKPTSKTATALGTIPVAFGREAVRAFFISGGSMQSVIVGGIKESIQQIHIVLNAKTEPKAGEGGAGAGTQTAPPQPAALEPPTNAPNPSQPAA